MRRNGETQKSIEIESPSSTRIDSNARKKGTTADGISGAFRLLSDKESARYLGISRSLLRAYINAGMLHRVLLKHPSGYGYIKRMLLDIRDLDSFIERQTKKTGG